MNHVRASWAAKAVTVVGFAAIVAGAACSPDPGTSTARGPSSASQAIPLVSTSDLPAARPNEIHLFGFNDFHGNLQPPEGSGGKIAGYPAGGAAYFATHMRKLTTAYPDNAILLAGDDIGASPLASALFHDEPSIKFYNRLGVRASSVGNHEFDHGIAELTRITQGGCAPDGCEPGDSFTGAAFTYLAANVTDAAGAQPPGLKPWTMIEVGGHKIGVIGAVTKDTANIVLPQGIKGYSFGDEAQAVNKYVPEAKAAGAQTIVVLVHEGGQQTTPVGSDADYNKCDNITPKATELATQMDPAVSVIFSGHTHQPYVCSIAGKLITQASFYGKLITDVSLTFDGDKLVDKKAVNRVVTRDVVPDPEVAKLVDFYGEQVKPRINRVVGTISADITKKPFPGGDTPMGDLIADSMLAATKDTDRGGAVAAFMNPGGVRADLVAKADPTNTSEQRKDGEVTYGEIYTAQPFTNQVVTLALTGQQILALLEEQWDNPSQPATLDVAGLTYAYLGAGEKEHKIVASSVTIGAQPLNPAGVYRVATNNFLASGGDGFMVFKQGRDEVAGPIDLDALEAYFKQVGTVSPPSTGRITPQ
ncbi:MAG: bifunctional metallophosphatase/5'-nucleotidase [Pseudonocardia sp.]|nr:bifunctional metallophosphatase/5'-nucleotidase [Pseudonocardia sp.]